MKPAPELTRVAKPRADARVVLDRNRQIREANQAAHRLLGRPDGTLVGLPLAGVIQPARHALLLHLDQALRDAQKLSLETVLVCDDGTLLPVVLITQPCTSARGQELALTFELDEEPTIVDAAASAEASSPAAPSPAPAASCSRADPRASTHARRPTTSESHARGSLRTTEPTRLSARPPAPPGDARRQRPTREGAKGKLPAELVLRGEVAEQLAACVELLSWLDAQLDRQGAQKATRERALARVVLQEVSTLLEQSRAQLTR